MVQRTLEIKTQGPGLYEITDLVTGFISAAKPASGLLTAFIQHTSASLVIQENADPSVQVDLLAYLERLVPLASDPKMSFLRHLQEGSDDMPAHIKAALLPTHLSIPVIDRRLELGIWQGVFIVEHRTAPHQRKVVLHLS